MYTWTRGLYYMSTVLLVVAPSEIDTRLWPWTLRKGRQIRLQPSLQSRCIISLRKRTPTNAYKKGFRQQCKIPRLFVTSSTCSIISLDLQSSSTITFCCRRVYMIKLTLYGSQQKQNTSVTSSDIRMAPFFASLFWLLHRVITSAA